MPKTLDVRVAENGRMVLPRPVRDALGLRAGGRVTLTIEDDTVRLTPMRHGVRRAQELYRQHAATNRTVDDFLRDRRAEAEADERSAAADPKKGEDDRGVGTG